MRRVGRSMQQRKRAQIRVALTVAMTLAATVSNGGTLQAPMAVSVTLVTRCRVPASHHFRWRDPRDERRTLEARTSLALCPDDAVDARFDGMSSVRRGILERCSPQGCRHLPSYGWRDDSEGRADEPVLTLVF